MYTRRWMPLLGNGGDVAVKDFRRQFIPYIVIYYLRYLCLLLLFLNINLYNNKRKENGYWAPLNINGGRCCIIGSCVSRDDGGGREGRRRAEDDLVLGAEATATGGLDRRAGGQAGRQGFGW